MVHIKELVTGAKESKKGMLELVVGIWTIVLILALVVILVTSIDFLTKKSKDVNRGNGEGKGGVVEESPSPEPTVMATSEPEIEGGGEGDLIGEENPEEEGEGFKEEESEGSKDPEPTKKPDKEEGDETLYTTTLVNMRSSASLNASILTRIPKDSVVVRTKKLENGWSKIFYDGKDGYVRTEYLTKTRSSGSDTNDNTAKVTTPKPVASKPKSTPKPKKNPTPAKTAKPTSKPNHKVEQELDDDKPQKTEAPVPTEPPVQVTDSPSDMEQNFE